MRSYAIFIHCDADSGMYFVDVPDLPAVVTEGTTEAEAVANAWEAIRSHLACLPCRMWLMPRDKAADLIFPEASRGAREESEGYRGMNGTDVSMVIESGGNVVADREVVEPDETLVKAELAHAIGALVSTRQLT